MPADFCSNSLMPVEMFTVLAQSRMTDAFHSKQDFLKGNGASITPAWVVQQFVPYAAILLVLHAEQGLLMLQRTRVCTVCSSHCTRMGRVKIAGIQELG